MADGTFATAINCIDGRVQTPVAEWTKALAGADFVDMVTTPGPDAALTDGSADRTAAMRAAVEISVRAHGSTLIVIAGHHDCAAFPADESAHRAAIERAVEVVASWQLPARVMGVWVNQRWLVERVVTREPDHG